MMVVVCMLMCFFFKQKTAYEMRISDSSSDVCSSDLSRGKYKPPEITRWRKTHVVGGGVLAMLVNANKHIQHTPATQFEETLHTASRSSPAARMEIGRASWRERVCQYV